MWASGRVALSHSIRGGVVSASALGTGGFLATFPGTLLSVDYSGSVALSEAESEGVFEGGFEGVASGLAFGTRGVLRRIVRKGGSTEASKGLLAGLRVGSERVSRSGFGNTWHSPKGSERGLPGWHVPKGFFEGVFRDGFRRWIRDRQLGFHRLDRTGVS